jgi:tetratricopeptide (TPR) repeat protein
LNRRAPDDVLVYGFIADANSELGNYKAAEEAAQWMLDLRPDNVPGLTRGAYLREIFGDVDGAMEFLRSAYQRTAPAEVEDRAWILTQLSHLELVNGNTANAEKLAGSGLKLFPGYHYALGQLAAVRTGQKRHAEAVDLLRQRYDSAPHPENLYPLAEALERAGRAAEASASFTEFERRARAESASADNANRELVFYYADHARKPADALRIAEREFAARRDVYTLDAYAWALHASGDYARANEQIQTAIATGVRTPEILEHARVIVADYQKITLSATKATATAAAQNMGRLKTGNAPSDGISVIP